MSDARDLPKPIERAIAALVLDLADLIEVMGLQWELDRQMGLEP